MDEFFDAHFAIGNKNYTYCLDDDQSVELYRQIGGFFAFISTGEGGMGIVDVIFRETTKFGKQTAQTFNLDPTEALILYRGLAAHLQKRYPGSEPQIRLREIGI